MMNQTEGICLACGQKYTQRFEWYTLCNPCQQSCEEFALEDFNIGYTGRAVRMEIWKYQHIKGFENIAHEYCTKICDIEKEVILLGRHEAGWI